LATVGQLIYVKLKHYLAVALLFMITISEFRQLKFLPPKLISACPKSYSFTICSLLLCLDADAANVQTLKQTKSIC